MESHVPRDRALDGSQLILKSFIEEYKFSPELWDPKDHNYTNKYRRGEAQDRLLMILRRLQSDATRIDVRKKINTFRSNYNKKAAMVRAAAAQGREYIPGSWLYHELRFLDTIKKSDVKAESNENESEDGDDCEREMADDTLNGVKFEVQSYPNAVNYIEIGGNQETYGEVENVDMEPTDKKPKLNHIIIENVSSSAGTPRKPKPKQQRRRSDPKTERVHSSSSLTAIEPIALVWSSKLQSLQPTQRLFAEKAINDILFEASLNNLQKGPIVINSGMSSVSYTEAEGFPVEVQEEYIEYLSTDEGEVS